MTQLQHAIKIVWGNNKSESGNLYKNTVQHSEENGCNLCFQLFAYNMSVVIVLKNHGPYSLNIFIVFLTLFFWCKVRKKLKLIHVFFSIQIMLFKFYLNLKYT